MSTTGERIRELRKLHGLTLDDVAKYLGIGRQAVYKYEHGTVTNIPLENLDKMAALFNVTPGYLAGWSEDTHGDVMSVVIPDSEKFRKIMMAMSADDYAMVISAFERTYNRMKEKGEIE